MDIDPRGPRFGAVITVAGATGAGIAFTALALIAAFLTRPSTSAWAARRICSSSGT
jgi:hypothetical protein